MNCKQTLLALSLLVIAAPAMADDTSTAACGTGRVGGPQKAELGFVETLDETKVYVDGKEIPRDGFQTQMRGDVQILTIFGEGDQDDEKFDISVSNKNAQKFTVRPDGSASKKQGGPLPCVLKGF